MALTVADLKAINTPMYACGLEMISHCSDREQLLVSKMSQRHGERRRLGQ